MSGLDIICSECGHFDNEHRPSCQYPIVAGAGFHECRCRGFVPLRYALSAIGSHGE